jgi:hypothetical protein
LSNEFRTRLKYNKGALIALKPNLNDTVINSNTPVLIFQYNPETLTRTISTSITDEVSTIKDKKDSNIIITEIINLNLEFDSTDQLEQLNQNKDSVTNGLHPVLATLESIIYSQSENKKSKRPIIFFLWGPNRVIPVWVDQIQIVEEAFDPNLNPIRLKINLNMSVRILTESEKGSLEYIISSNQLDLKRKFKKLYKKEKINPQLLEKISNDINNFRGKSK